MRARSSDARRCSTKSTIACSSGHAISTMLSSREAGFMTADSPPLVQWWLEASGEAAGRDPQEWQAALHDALERARTAWPTIALDARTFVHALARALDRGAEPSR